MSEWTSVSEIRACFSPCSLLSQIPVFIRPQPPSQASASTPRLLWEAHPHCPAGPAGPHLPGLLGLVQVVSRL